MQQPQQGSDNYAGGGGGGVSQEMLSFGSSSAPRGQMLGGEAEAASPISSRPPASINFDELRDVAAGAETDPDRGGGGGSLSSGNRWPRQETLALLNIRSEMDVAFRDATLKGPLWDEVSRKLGELGYNRSAKKCKEKFENVHKYYKRTKEGRAGRQDGKSYRFFTQLEAMQGAGTASGSGGGGGGGGANLISSNIITPAMTTSGPLPPPPPGNIQFGTPASAAAGGVMRSGVVPPSQPFMLYSSGLSAGMAAPGSGQPLPVAPAGISFSSDSGSSGSFDSEEEEVDDVSEEEELFGAAAAGSGQKRKRGSSKGGGKRRMMDFFEGLMKQVMQKQEAMQQRFLEVIEKREQDRLLRDEAWKRQEAARLSREQELAAQERAIAASRDAAIVSFLQKITGQTIQLPQPVYTSVAPPAFSSAPVAVSTAPPSRQQFQQMPQQHQVQHHQSQHKELIRQQQQQMPPPSTDAIMAVPERQIPPQDPQTGGSSSEPASSRWPKAEVLALIKLRSNLENRYQEAGPKGPLWEEISAGMQQMGYSRSSKRCKEKWENINKYFKKVKESNKKRPEDAKTCPYFNELDALYQRKKLLGSSSSSIPPFQLQPAITIHQETPASNPEVTVQASAALPVESVPELTQGPGPAEPIFDDQETNAGGSTKPEDIMKEQQVSDQKMDELLDEENEDEGDDERKMGYKIEFQRSPTSNNNKNGASSTSFITMVQ